LVCRLYPVGRAVDADMNSYFFLTRTGDYCKLGCGKEYTIEEWLGKAEVEPYFEWNDRFNSLYMEIDYKKYKALDLSYKAAFGNILYDLGALEKILTCERLEVLSMSDAGARLHVNYELAKRFVEKFMK